jgi:hypothetical protein
LDLQRKMHQRKAANDYGNTKNAGQTILEAHASTTQEGATPVGVAGDESAL